MVDAGSNWLGPKWTRLIRRLDWRRRKMKRLSLVSIGWIVTIAGLLLLICASCTFNLINVDQRVPAQTPTTQKSDSFLDTMRGIFNG